MRGFLCWVLTLLFCVSLCSCGSSDRERRQTFPVTGKLTIDGQPVGKVQVAAKGKGPQDPNFPISPQALTADDGSFAFESYEPGDGLPADEYVLTVRWEEAKGPVFQGPDKLGGRYSDPANPARTFTVKDEAVDLGTIELTTK